MSPAGIVELSLSLAMQISVVIGVCGWLVRQSGSEETGHRLWGMCHLMILALTAGAVLLPHLRVIPHSVVSESLPLPTAAAVQDWMGRILFFMWGIGALLYVAALCLGTFNARRLISSAVPFHRDLDLELGEVKLLISRDVTMPFCWQLQQPLIVLPENVRTFPDDELGAIVRHELAHLRSAHPLFLFLQRVVELLYWFHPLVWWASRQANLYREFHCDRKSIRSARETASYLRSLLRLSETAGEAAANLPAGLAFHGQRSDLRRRVERLMAEQIRETSTRTKTAAAVIVAAAVAAAVVWLPLDVSASSRSVWSPWPRWSARALYEAGISARDYEIDGHRSRPHEIEHENSELSIADRSGDDETDAR